jgi:acyl carrier protein
MNRSEMKNLVTATLARHLNKNEQIVTEDAELFDDLQADSLDIVELTLEFEEMFKIEIPDDDLEQLTTVGDTIDLLLRKVNQNMIEEPEVESPEVEPNPPEDPEEDAPVQENDPEEDPEEEE